MGLKLHLKRARKEKKNVDLWGINSNNHAIYIVTAYVIQMFVMYFFASFPCFRKRK